MAVSASRNVTTAELIRFGHGLIDQFATIAEDATGAEIPFGTVMAYNHDSEKWEPFTAVEGDNGTAWPSGIYVGDDISQATHRAGDVTDAPILKGGLGVLVDEGKVTVTGELTLDTVLNATNENGDVVDYFERTVRQALAMVGIHIENAVDISGHQ